MKNLLATFKLASVVALTAAAAMPAQAITRVVEFNILNASGTIATPFALGDTLVLDSTVTQETGALSQSITFTLAAGITALTGQAVWEISAATGPGPRLTGVNIDILDAANNVVISDVTAGTLGGFAVSTINGNIGPGTYRMVATGTAVRDTILDVSVSMVPEPHTYALMLAGLAAIGVLKRRRIG